MSATPRLRADFLAGLATGRPKLGGGCGQFIRFLVPPRFFRAASVPGHPIRRGFVRSRRWARCNMSDRWIQRNLFREFSLRVYGVGMDLFAFSAPHG